MSQSHERSSDPADLMAQRYAHGDPRRRKRVIAGSGIVGVLALGWLGWGLWATLTPEVTSTLRTYDVVSPQEATADVVVTLAEPGLVATCVVRASAADSSVVGEQTFEVTGAEGAQVVDVSVRTEREATTVQSVGCTTPGQSRPR